MVGRFSARRSPWSMRVEKPSRQSAASAKGSMRFRSIALAKAASCAPSAPASRLRSARWIITAPILLLSHLHCLVQNELIHPRGQQNVLGSRLGTCRGCGHVIGGVPPDPQSPYGSVVLRSVLFLRVSRPSLPDRLAARPLYPL